MEKEKRIFDDYIDDELKNNEEEDSSIIDELKEELEEIESESEAEEDAGASEDELSKCQALLEEEHSKYLYALADLDNLRKRHAKELPDVRWNASASVLREMIEVADAFELAIQQNQELENDNDFDNKTSSIIKGFDLIYNKLNTALENLGCIKMDVHPKNDVYVDFDTDFHEAISIINLQNKKLDGKIIDVQQNGYMFKDRVLRHAKVVVGKFTEQN
jgi:molecular chaperone GrpE